MKYRLGLLVGAVVKLIMKMSKEIAEPYDIEFEQIGCDNDQLYILYGIRELLQDRLLRCSKASYH